MSENQDPAGFRYGLANLKPVSPADNVVLTFPDGATDRRTVEL